MDQRQRLVNQPQPEDKPKDPIKIPMTLKDLIEEELRRDKEANK